MLTIVEYLLDACNNQVLIEHSFKEFLSFSLITLVGITMCEKYEDLLISRNLVFHISDPTSTTICSIKISFPVLMLSASGADGHRRTCRTGDSQLSISK